MSKVNVNFSLEKKYFTDIPHQEKAEKNVIQNDPLGITTKTSSPEQESRINKYILKAEVNKLFSEFVLSGKYVFNSEIKSWIDKSSGEILESFKDVDRNTFKDLNRTYNCMRLRSIGDEITIHKHQETNKAFYKGLTTCARVWNCPICATKISERRKIELRYLIDSVLKEGHKIYFLTLTNRHGYNHNLKAILEAQKKVLLKMTSGKNSVKNNLSSNGIDQLGYVRVLENTHGKHGWHPHFHILLIIDTSKNEHETIDLLQKVYDKKWIESWRNLQKRIKDNSFEIDKLIPLSKDSKGNNIAVTVTSGTRTEIDKYMTKTNLKWNIEAELTKSHQKVSKSEEGVTAWDLLRIMSGQKEKKGYSYPKARSLFLEYIKMMKGSRQMYWSNGLKSKFGIIDQTDEDILKDIDTPSFLLSNIELRIWKNILKAKKEADVLNKAENLEIGEFVNYLNSFINHKIINNASN